MRAVLSLIDPVLMDQQFVNTANALDQLIGQAGLATVKQIGKEPADCGHDYGEEAKEALLRFSYPLGGTVAAWRSRLRAERPARPWRCGPARSWAWG